MSLTRNGSAPPLPGGGGRAGGDGRAAAARRHLTELERLIRVLEHHVPVHEVSLHRDLALLGPGDAAGRAEPHLRAVTALLVSLATYQDASRRTVTARSRRPAPPAPVRAGARVNGHHPNGRSPDGRPPGEGTPTDRELAAAAATYIARDLAARQLSEFTSAEGYRLARALAKAGGVEAPVERLLTEANQLRLHPMPLADAVSHSPH